LLGYCLPSALRAAAEFEGLGFSSEDLVAEAICATLGVIEEWSPSSSTKVTRYLRWQVNVQVRNWLRKKVCESWGIPQLAFPLIRLYLQAQDTFRQETGEEAGWEEAKIIGQRVRKRAEEEGVRWRKGWEEHLVVLHRCYLSREGNLLSKSASDLTDEFEGWVQGWEEEERIFRMRELLPFHLRPMVEKLAGLREESWEKLGEMVGVGRSRSYQLRQQTLVWLRRLLSFPYGWQRNLWDSWRAEF